MPQDADVSLVSTAGITATVAMYPIKPIWVSPDEVRKQKRVYG